MFPLVECATHALLRSWLFHISVVDFRQRVCLGITYQHVCSSVLAFFFLFLSSFAITSIVSNELESKGVTYTTS